MATANLNRQSTEAASVPLVGGFATLGVAMSRLLDKRIAFRLPIVIAGAMLAGRLPAGFGVPVSMTIGIAFMNCFNRWARTLPR